MSYRTAAISCFALIGGLFGYPAIIWAIFLPSLKQGLPNPLPAYEKTLLDVAVWRGMWKGVLLLPLLGLGILLTIVNATQSRSSGRA